ncbi:uncharacterized protein LOC106084284 [Stomoxys calcitrans]|uniref:uncharacterized protein LOC106084284 n=1 Tax=Stomoxys calcitrans TaxID=35570 RepID=UPI0027E33081|nr:uncharacterized protein LOC106084284 [Stomoxys calcitrans]
MLRFAILLISALVLCEAHVGSRQQEWCLGDFAKGVLNMCAEKNNVGKAAIEDFLKGKLSNNKNERCFRACFLMECEYFEGYGGFKSDTQLRLATQFALRYPSKYKVAKKIVGSCMFALSEPNVCDTAEELFKCIKLNSPFPLTLQGI